MSNIKQIILANATV